MLKRNGPLHYDHLLASDSETESDDLSSYHGAKAQKRDDSKGKKIEGENCGSVKKAKKDEPDVAAMIRHAEIYQESMKKIRIPSSRGSVIPFITWQGLAKSMKELYEQPLHYLTNVQLKQWDKMRIGAEDEYKPMDCIINPRKAEATIWLIEEVHRRSISHHHLANLWLSDPMYQVFVDPC